MDRSVGPSRRTVTGTGVHSSRRASATWPATSPSAPRDGQDRRDRARQHDARPGDPDPTARTGRRDRQRRHDSGVDAVEWKIDGGPFIGRRRAPMRRSPGTAARTSSRHTSSTTPATVSAWRSDTSPSTTRATTTPRRPSTPRRPPTGWRKNAFTLRCRRSTTAPASRVEYILARMPADVSEHLAGDLHDHRRGRHTLETGSTTARRATPNDHPWRDHVDFKIDLDSRSTRSSSRRAGRTRAPVHALGATDAHLRHRRDPVHDRRRPGSVRHANGDTVNVGPTAIYTVKSRARDNAGHSSGHHADAEGRHHSPANTSAPAPTAWRRRRSRLPLSGTDAGRASRRCSGALGRRRDPRRRSRRGHPGRRPHARDARRRHRRQPVRPGAADTVRIDATEADNTTPAAPTGWRKTPYTVEITGDDGAAPASTGSSARSTAAPSRRPERDDHRRRRAHAAQPHRRRGRQRSDWRDELIKIDTAAPQAALSCSAAADVWSRVPVTCTVTADGGPSGLGSATLAGADGGTAAVANGAVATVSSDGGHTLQPRRRRRRRQRRGRRPRPSTSIAPRRRPACRAPPSTASTPAAPTRRTPPPAWPRSAGASTAARSRPIAAGGTFTVAKGQVRLRAVDAAGNETITESGDAGRDPGRRQGADLERPGLPRRPQGHAEHAGRAERRPQRHRHGVARPAAAGRRPRALPRRDRAEVRQALQEGQAQLQGRAHRRPAAHQRLAQQGGREDARSR